MKRTTVALLGLAVLVLTLAAAASAKTSVVGGSVTITGSGTQWSLTFDNAATSTGSVKCWRYTFPPGIQATAIGTPPTGWTVGGSKPPPAPILAGRSATGIPPGGRASFPIVTDKPFDRSGSAGTAAISEDCVTDVFAPPRFGSQPPPPPPLATCRCKKLTIREIDPRMRSGSIKMEIEWTLRCQRKSGASCEAMFQIVAPKKKFPLVIKKTENTCKGACKAKNNGQTIVSIPYSDGSPRPRFAGETIRLTLKKYCRQGNAYRPAGAQTATIAVGEDGRLDRVQSDLDADGRPDGDEKR
jgi:hypothetical protein